jgi:hypothetical protein
METGCVRFSIVRRVVVLRKEQAAALRLPTRATSDAERMKRRLVPRGRRAACRFLRSKLASWNEPTVTYRSSSRLVACNGTARLTLLPQFANSIYVVLSIEARPSVRFTGSVLRVCAP